MTLLAIVALGCTSVLVASGPSLAASGSTGGAVGAWIRHDNDVFGSNWLTGVKALAPNDVWVVGNHPNSRTDFQPVMRHFDGATWSRVGHLQKPAGTSCIPSSVDALSDDDVWLTCINGTTGVPLVEHWDGTAWRLQDIPNTGGYTDLWHVWEDSPDDVWAVGRFEGPGTSTGLVDHFDGRRWEQMEVPVLSGTELFGVSGTSPDDVWAVGRDQPNGGAFQPLTLHWDGSSWQQVDSIVSSVQGGLESVVALSPTEVWAAGWLDSDRGLRGLVLRWDGQTWVDTQADTVNSVYLTGVTALSGNDVWVVGDLLEKFPAQPAASHWDGHAWTSYPPRHPGQGEDRLGAVSMADHDDVWAVGRWSGQSDWVRMYQYWDGTTWHRHTMP